MYYLIYKITNTINNKFYVGKHKTKNKEDSYFGSGLLLERAVEKYGKKSFVKEITYECSSEEEMNQMEADIVDEEFIARLDTYNIKLGGEGGFGHINGSNHTKEALEKALKTRLREDNEFGEKVSNGLKLYYAKHDNPFLGKHHSEETKEKMSEAKKGMFDGKKNPSYGKWWITNGTESKLVQKGLVLLGWRRGRV